MTYIGTDKEIERIANHNYLKANDKSSVFDNAVIVPYRDRGRCCVYDSSGCFVESSGDTDDKDYQYKKTINVPEIYVDKEVVYIGWINDNWGFFFIDSLSRLWYVLDNPSKYLLAYCGQGYEQNTLGVHAEYAYSILKLLGISKEQLIDVRTPTRFKSVIVPSKSFRHIEVPTFGRKTPYAYTQQCSNDSSNYFITPKFASIYNRIADNCNLKLPKYDKVYFSRSQLKKKKEVGEKSLEKIFESNGFKILYPERLNPAEQVWYVKNAKILASVEGTLAHNSVFSQDGVIQIILRKQSEIIPRQFMINQVIGVKTVWVDSFAEPFSNIPISHSKGPFLLQANENVKQMCEELGYIYIKPSVISKTIDVITYCIKCIEFSLEKRMKSIIKK